MAGEIVDSTGHRLILPERVERVMAAGPNAAVLLYVVAPEKMVGWPSAPRPAEREFIMPSARDLPEIGRLTGRGDTANIEVVMGALAGACISLVKVLADPYDQLPAITFWVLGSLAGVKANDLIAVFPLALAGLVPLILLRWRIGVLSLGEDEARSLGVDVTRMRALVILAATLMTASVVAICGVIGWIGLMIPHVARMLVGPNFHRLLPAAMLLGATFLLLVDTLARTMARIETPLGILTALPGGPFFLWLLARGRGSWG